MKSAVREHEPSCLSDTRLAVLQQINTWAEDGCHERCVFWLNVMVGTGKFTIARTVAREHRTQKRLGTNVFFS